MIKPLANYIVLKPIVTSAALPGAFEAPDTSKVEPLEAEVVALGPLTIAGTLTVGDVVVFNKWQGVKVKDNGNDFILIEDKHIFGIKKEEVKNG